jgi:hypothetical protein
MLEPIVVFIKMKTTILFIFEAFMQIRSQNSLEISIAKAHH